MIKKNKNKLIICIIVGFLVISTLLPIFISFGKKTENKKENVVITDTELNIVNYDIQFEQNAMFINLLFGSIKTNAKIDNVFINVNGYGVQDLDFTQESLSGDFYLITIKKTSGILNTVFDNDVKLTADIYVEYADRSHKVVSKKIDVKSCWIGPY